MVLSSTLLTAGHSSSCNIANFQVLFYLPIYFQSVHGQSAISSGVNSLPFMAFFAFGAIFSGFLIMKTHLLQPYELLSALLTVAGAALLYTLEIDSSEARYIGPQVLIGFGIGLGNQVPMTALQSFSKPEDVASTTGIMLSEYQGAQLSICHILLTLALVCNSISGAYFVTAAQSLFANRLLTTLASNAPNIDTYKVLSTGASDIQRVFSDQDLPAVLDAYMVGVKDVFAFSMAGAAFLVLIALAIPLKKLPSQDSQKIEEKEVTTLA